MSENKAISLNRIILTRKPQSVQMHWNDNKDFKIYAPLSDDDFKSISGAIGNIGKVNAEAILLDPEVVYVVTPKTEGNIQ